jgi:hypothetical protein
MWIDELDGEFCELNNASAHLWKGAVAWRYDYIYQ